MDDATRGSALIYPFDEKPEPGCVVELTDGVYWLRMPLPFRLNHINLYLLRDGDGWTVVDTGIGGHDTRKHWETLFRDVMDNRPIKKIIVTHMHPDHIGQAGWLTRYSQAQVWISRTEFFMCKMLCSDGPADVPDDAIRFYHQAGFTAEQLERYKQGYGQFGAMVEPLPAGYRRIEDGNRIVIDGSQWEVVIGRGHSPEHACLYSLDHKVLLSGDQILPRISSNVSVFPTEPAADPLHDWLSSCVALRARLPDDVLVCPAHNEPFTGLHTRLSALIAGIIYGADDPILFMIMQIVAMLLMVPTFGALQDAGPLAGKFSGKIGMITGCARPASSSPFSHASSPVSPGPP